jgi:long-subunit acyl-CoA synthetase (AMP-forming)
VITVTGHVVKCEKSIYGRIAYTCIHTMSTEYILDISSIIFLIIIMVFIVTIYYYCWYIKTETTENVKEISMSMLNQPDVTIIDIFRKNVKKYPQHEALKYCNKSITYLEYYEKSYRFAEKLMEDIGPNARIGIMCANRPERYYVHMGTMMCGGISIGMDMNDDMEKILSNFCVDVLIIDAYGALIKILDTKIPMVKKILYIDLDMMDEMTLFMVKNIEENNNHLTITSYDDFTNSNTWLPTFNSSANIVFKNPQPEDIVQIMVDKSDNGIGITHEKIISALKSCMNIIQSRSNVSIGMHEKYTSYIGLNDTISQLVTVYMPMISCGTVFIQSNDKNILCKELKYNFKPSICIGSVDTWNRLSKRIKKKQQETQKILNKLFINKMILKEFGLNEAKYCIIKRELSTSNEEITQLIGHFEELGIELCVMFGIKEEMGPISICVPGCSKGIGVPIIGIKNMCRYKYF